MISRLFDLRTRAAIAAFSGSLVVSFLIGVVIGLRFDVPLLTEFILPLIGLAVVGGFASAILVGVAISQDVTALKRIERIVRTRLVGGQSRYTLLSRRTETQLLARSLEEATTELQQNLHELELDHARLEAVLESMTDGVVIVDSDDTVSLVNRAAGDLLGVETRMEGQVTLANALRDSDLVELIREPSNRGTSINRLLTIVATAREVHAVVVPLGRQDDQQRLVLLRDLTVLRQTEAVRRDFVANVSHELRTPVSALRAMAETLEGRAADDDETRADFIRRIVVETDRLGQIITELLDLARIESGMSDLDLAVVDLNNIVGVSADRLRPQAMRNDLKLDIGLSPDSLVIWADADRVGRVVMSLIHNAIKFTPPGGSITVVTKLFDGAAQMSVIDTGQGLDRRDLDRVFERFYKSDPARTGLGAGLGLSIARQTIREHGGRIWAESSGPAQGATFTIAFPLLRSEGGLTAT